MKAVLQNYPYLQNKKQTTQKHCIKTAYVLGKLLEFNLFYHFLLQ